MILMFWFFVCAWPHKLLHEFLVCLSRALRWILIDLLIYYSARHHKIICLNYLHLISFDDHYIWWCVGLSGRVEWFNGIFANYAPLADIFGWPFIWNEFAEFACGMSKWLECQKYKRTLFNIYMKWERERGEETWKKTEKGQIHAFC